VAESINGLYTTQRYSNRIVVFFLIFGTPYLPSRFVYLTMKIKVKDEYAQNNQNALVYDLLKIFDLKIK